MFYEGLKIEYWYENNLNFKVILLITIPNFFNIYT